MKASQKTGLIRQVWYWPRGVGAADRRMSGSIRPSRQSRRRWSVALHSLPGSIPPFMLMNAKGVIMPIEPNHSCFDLRAA